MSPATPTCATKNRKARNCTEGIICSGASGVARDTGTRLPLSNLGLTSITLFWTQMRHTGTALRLQCRILFRVTMGSCYQDKDAEDTSERRASHGASQRKALKREKLSQTAPTNLWNVRLRTASLAAGLPLMPLRTADCTQTRRSTISKANDKPR